MNDRQCFVYGWSWSVFQNLVRCLSRQHYWGEFSKRVLLKDSSLGFKTQPACWVVCVCVCLCVAACRQRRWRYRWCERKPSAYRTPALASAVLERWQRFHGLPVSFTLHLPLSFSLPAVSASCFSAEIHPATWWGWVLAFWLESVYEN